MAAHKNHQDPEFRHLREVVLWAHDYTCYICKKQFLVLEVHHLDKQSTNHSLMNLVPACKPCHIYLGRISKLKYLSKNDIRQILMNKIQKYYVTVFELPDASKS